MSELLFKNSYIRDKNTIKEFYKHTIWGLRGQVINGLTRGVIFCGVFSWLIIHLLEINLYFIFVAIASYVGFYILFSLLRYFYRVKTEVERLAKHTDERGALCQSSVYNDEIIFEHSGKTTSLDISDIKSALETKNYICIFTKSNFIYELKKDSFTLGNSEDFVKFLRDNRIKIQK